MVSQKCLAMVALFPLGLGLPIKQIVFIFTSIF
jgi:hypothetical protein